MIKPEYVKVGDNKYKINTSYKVAIRCDEIVKDKSIGTIEKSLAIIYLLFGEKALREEKDQNKLIELAFKYLRCGQEENIEDDQEWDMDFNQDYNLIKASFKTDLNINLDEEDLHWWDFYTYLNGLKEDCVLNRVRELRTFDTSKISDKKEREKIEKQKQRFKLKKEEKFELSEKQKQSADKFYELTGIKRK